MPWHQEPMKDVGGCDKPRGAVKPSCDPRMSRMGKPSTSDVVLPAPEYIGRVEGTWGSETSQYPQEEKTTVIP